ncbi:MAG: sigma-70 family RNA polymerase sigma factor [Elusimicrobiales bacterium]|nr:sigma-70 family RNA polymerase sigma factor [Elusimicrobiales bacterium]
MAETETELVRRCLEGDNSAFAGILEAYQDRIYSFALRLLKDPVAAEEASQEAFVKAFRGLSSYNSAYHFSSWLFRIAHNACMDALRAGNKTVSLDTEDFPDLPDRSAGVEAKVEDSITSERIEAMLAALPPLYSEVLLLAYKENMGSSEIALVLGAPEGTVKARLFRARELMKVKLYREAGATF